VGGLGDEDVARLDVAVHHATRVRVGQRVAQGDADEQDVAVGEGALGDEVGQRRPADQLRDEVDRARVAPRLEERDDARVPQAGGREALALGPRGGRSVVHGDPLHRDGAPEMLVARHPDHAEATRAEPVLEPVAAEHPDPAEPRLGAVRARAGGRVVDGLHRLPGFGGARLRPAGRCRDGRLDGELAGPDRAGHPEAGSYWPIGSPQGASVVVLRRG
jgi:hypothetical protein